MKTQALLFALVLILAAPVRAAPVTLRMATIAPEGTAWAREFKALSREIDVATSGEVQMKWYLGGIAGDDIEAARRVARDQLDGVGGGVWQCERWIPSMKVTRLPGLFRSRNELKQVAARLRPLFEADALKAGFVFLGETIIGPSVMFLRQPARSLEELRRVRMWSLANDETKTSALRALGFTVVPLPFERSRQAFDEHQIDGYFTPPTGAVGFQWSAQTRYLIDLPTDYLLGCVVVTRAAFEALPLEHQAAVRGSVARFLALFDDESAHSDERLMGGLFEKQGLTKIKPDERFRRDFEAAAQQAWKKLDGMVPAALLAQVQAMLDALRKR